MHFRLLFPGKQILPTCEKEERIVVVPSFISDTNQIKITGLSSARFVHVNSSTETLDDLIQEISESISEEKPEGIAFVVSGTSDFFTLVDGIQVPLNHINGSEELQDFWGNIKGLITDDGTVDILVTDGINKPSPTFHIPPSSSQSSISPGSDFSHFLIKPSNIQFEVFAFRTADGRVITTSLKIIPPAEHIQTKDPDNGVLQIHSDGSFTYSPDEGLVGADSATVSLICENEVIQVHFTIDIDDPKVYDTLTDSDHSEVNAAAAFAIREGADDALLLTAPRSCINELIKRDLSEIQQSKTSLTRFNGNNK